jgi:hypothetical protein
MLETTYEIPYKYKQRAKSFSKIDRSVDQYSENQLEYYTNAYDGPSLLLFDLQNLVGPETFEKILKALYQQNITKFGSKQKLLRVIEQYAGSEVSQKVEKSLGDEKYTYGALFL